MDELDVILRARRLSRLLTRDQLRLPLDAYLKSMIDLPKNIVLRFDDTLGKDEAGHTLAIAGRKCIIINGKDAAARQRFTACHEVAHIVLGLPTQHDNAGS